jgi:hypothetical protein
MATAIKNIRSLCAHPDNPHYMMYKGKPVVLITSDQHYGAVINMDFDYTVFLDVLSTNGMNFTRIYPGAYIEKDGEYMKDNNLGPRNGRQILPWARTTVTGAHEVLGGYKLDLDTWNEAYFKRLKDFVSKARDRDIIVDIAFFNGMYRDRWAFHPMYHTNNIQGVGTCDYKMVQTLEDRALADRHEAYVKKITEEVIDFENVILDICDEPNIEGCSPDLYNPWLSRMINAVQEVEKPLQASKKHLIMQTIEPYTKPVPKDSPGDFSSDRRITATAHEYTWGIAHLDTEYEHDRPMVLIETSYYPGYYRDHKIDSSRVEAWEFIVGGGAAFMQLNGLYSTFNPGAKNTENDTLLNQLKILRSFIYSFDFIKMRKDTSFTVEGMSKNIFVRAISEPGKQYAI